MAVIPMGSSGKVLGTLFAITHGIREFSEQDIQLLTSIGNQIGVAVENARLFEAEQRRAEQFRVIGEIGRRMTSILDINDLLVQVVRLIQKSFNYDHVGIALIEGEYAEYKVGSGELWDDPDFEFKPARLKIGEEGVTGWVASTGEPLLLPDVTLDERYVLMHGSKTRSELAVPMIAKGKLVGVLDAQSERVNAFDEIDLVLLQSLANQAAIAFENAHLYKSAQQAAVMAERSRLARDLHDSVTQSLYSLILLAEAGGRMIDSGDKDKILSNQARLGDIAQQALQEMRLMVYELRPPILRSEGLVGALEQRLETVERRAGVEATLLTKGDVKIPGDVEEELYLMAQEALNNALKHAMADEVTISIQTFEDTLQMEIADNGQGFENQRVRDKGGLGLVNMQERAEEIGAKLSIQSGPDEGTRVTVTLNMKGKS
jgi:signal transduction histidine kinase